MRLRRHYRGWNGIKPFYVFVHMHRCAGTSVVKMMKNQSHIKFYQPNYNGNPSESNEGKILKLWNYSEEEWDAFYKKCEENGFNAICHEWGFPVESKQYLGDFTYFTVLRNPLNRMISSYNRDLDFLPSMDITEYYRVMKPRVDNFFVSHTFDNYYVRLLARVRITEEVTLKHLEKAMNVLEKFSAVIILEDKSTWKNFEKIGLSSDLPVENKPVTINYVRNKEFEKRFIKENAFDYALYEFGKKLAKWMLK